MGDKDHRYNCEHEELWTKAPAQLPGPILFSEAYWPNYSFNPSASFDEIENQPLDLNNALIPLLTRRNQWDSYNTGSQNEDLLLDSVQYSMPSADNGISTGTSTSESSNLDSLFEGVDELQLHESCGLQELIIEERIYSSAKQSQQVVVSEGSQCSWQTPRKPRWTSKQNQIAVFETNPKATIEGFLSINQPALSHVAQSQIPVPNKTRKERPPILNSEPSYRHNLIEKKYRSKLNSEFETLLSVIPPDLVAEARRPEKSISKAEVLALAKEHIQRLELEGAGLENQRSALSAEIERMKEIWLSLGNGES